MGCAGSKLDDLQAVALCRERLSLLEAAIRHRYALAEAHRSYLQCLNSVSSSLERFFDCEPPLLSLPAHRKGDPDPGIDLGSDLDHSSSGSHLRLRSECDSDTGESGFNQVGLPPKTLDNAPIRYYFSYDQSNGPTATVFHEHWPRSPKAFGFVESFPDASTFYSRSSYSDPYANEGYGFSHTIQSPDTRRTSSRLAVTEVPPPPVASAWDFLNLFETSMDYYSPYTSGRLKELRKEEGIPDLEDEFHQQEVVKVVDAGCGGGGAAEATGVELGLAVETVTAGNAGGAECDVRTEQKAVNEEMGNMTPAKACEALDLQEVLSGIKKQFERASNSGGAVGKILEVGKHPYSGKNAVWKVSSKMLDSITPLPLLALTSSEKINALSVDIEEDIRMDYDSLSSAMEKLYIWEKKLCEEVKDVEKMRISHERKFRRLKYLDETGAEAHKIESARIMVRKLSAKLKIALQFIDSISSTISKLRDEELWPLINELIQGLAEMWKVMVECHHSQFQVMTEARKLNFYALSYIKHSDDYMEATLQLEQDLLNWILSFYSWISAMKSYVKALNGWLLMCILYEPEETDDGIVPFTPEGIGAPSIFVICNHWSQVIDRVSEKEVFNAMRGFSQNVLQMWDQYYLEQRQRMMTNKEMDKRIKFLDDEEQKMQKLLDIINKKLNLVSDENGLPSPGQIVHRNLCGSDDDRNLQSDLKQIFEAMEKFSDDCVKVYEELCLHIEESMSARENAKVS